MLLQCEAPKRRRCKPPLSALVRPSHADCRRLKEEVAVQVRKQRQDLLLLVLQGNAMAHAVKDFSR